MRREILLIVACLSIFSAIFATAQGVIVHKSDGTKIDIPYSELDSITTYKNSIDPETGILLSQEVDLGLSVKWAGWNVGATSPEEYGGYYAWGETEEKSDYWWDTYEYASDSNGNGYGDEGENFDDNEIIYIGSNISGTQYDVAHQKWGDSWRMPTYDEIEELINDCSWTWITYKGVNGQKVTGPNGNSIFLPAAGGRDGTSFDDKDSCGFYWSGTLCEDDRQSAYFIEFCSESPGYDIPTACYSGYPVRPVKDK